MDCVATNLLDHPAVRAIAVNYRDITDRKRAEAAQARREVELQESQRIARIGSWEWTAATGAMTWSEGMNHVLGRAHGLAAPSFEALPQFFTPDSWQRLESSSRGLSRRASYDLELDMIGADGVVRRTIRGEAIRGAMAPCCYAGPCTTSPSTTNWRRNFSRRRRWKPSDGWLAAWRTTSTIC